MQDKLSVASCANFNALVSMAIKIESKMLELDAETPQKSYNTSPWWYLLSTSVHGGNTSTSLNSNLHQNFE
ncbi:hypothetical protein U9M48_036324 [Paspalum notatum var. saurae]|uniref:Uncharacterized protein n=1 Tax=Paspalum notatum var. saurae TaxID=547442 RepID=A0AAQ3UIY2_PASNO